MKLTFGSLFAGIGGFDLGFERAGMVCKWQVEIGEYATQVLKKHWPDVPRWGDVQTFPPSGDWTVDVICGGFPCQDISNAGKRAGINGERSGLFFEAVRVVRELNPRYVVLENVAAILARGMDAVLGELAEIGLDAEWDVLPAGAFGMPHIRERVFVVAYPKRKGRQRVLQGLKRIGPPASCREEKPDSLDSLRGVVCGLEGLYSEPCVLGVDDGIPNRVDRLNAIGNAVCPDVAEWIGRRIVEASYA